MGPKAEESSLAQVVIVNEAEEVVYAQYVAQKEKVTGTLTPHSLCRCSTRFFLSCLLLCRAGLNCTASFPLAQTTAHTSVASNLTTCEVRLRLPRCKRTWRNYCGGVFLWATPCSMISR